MLAQIANISLILSFLSSISVIFSFYMLVFDNKEKFTSYINYLNIMQFCFISISFVILIYSFAISDFSILTIYKNSHTDKPLIFKITGTWGNHEGSILMWSWIFSFINVLFMIFSNIDPYKKSKILVVQSLLFVGFLSFIICVSNPFIVIYPIAKNGLGLNPLLQDIGLAFHPPTLYTGYVAFSIAFSTSIVCLLEGNFTKDISNKLYPWVLVSWIFLTSGIGLGSWWAYRELGWGGFWFWDPVENASLMPWLSGTALLHSLMVTKSTGKLKIWSILLSIITFLLNLLSTFLVRSGILTSVHSFANDPHRGFFILCFLSLTMLIAFVIFALRAYKIESKVTLKFFSRETMILLNNILLISGCFTIILGTLFPLIYEYVYKAPISVGEPYFISSFIPIMIPLLFLASVGSFINWGSDNFRRYIKSNILVLITCIIISFFFIVYYNLFNIKIIISFFFSIFLCLSMINLFCKRSDLYKLNISIFIDNIKLLPRNFYSMLIAHLGVGIFSLSLTLNVTLQQEKWQLMNIGDHSKFMNYDIYLQQIKSFKKDNYLSILAQLYIEENNCEIGNLTPEIRFYPIEKSQTIETSINSNLLRDLYSVIQPPDENNMFGVKLYYKPFMIWIWIGISIIVFAGLNSLYKSISYLSLYKKSPKTHIGS